MKKILFITGTRADYSKIKSLMKRVQNSTEFKLYIFVTGMHLSKNFGYTVKELYKNGFKNIYEFINYDKYYQTDKALATTIDGFSRYVNELKPDLIVVHGDRIEPLAAAIVGALNNILVAHIEGGEISGTIDDSLRHAISKLSHIHLVNDEIAKRRLIQLGEDEKSIFIIGSPDLELLNDNKISLSKAKKYYDIDYKNYALLMFHPVTTEITSIKNQADNLVKALIQSKKNYIVIYPNNDLGFELILQSYEVLKNNPRFKLFPSLRFEYFITFLKNADFIIGNSSCILKEALYLKTAGILVGTRQHGRFGNENTLKVNANSVEILKAINSIHKKQDLFNAKIESLDSSKLFFNHLASGDFFKLSTQKIFKDIK